MAYSDWQLRRLLHRLAAYRVWREKKFGSKSFENVASDIVNEEAIFSSLHLPQEDPIKALGESLRRFSDGKQTPEEPRLRALQKFLELKGFLSAIDLKEDKEPYHAAYALNEFFGDPSNKALAVCDSLEGVYRALTLLPGKIIDTALAVNFSRDDMILQATEIRTTYRDPKTIPFKDWSERERKAYKQAAVESNGWIVVKPEGLLVAFLRDARDGAVLCYAALTLSDIYDADAGLTLLRMERDFTEWLPDKVRNAHVDQDLLEKLRPHLLSFHRESQTTPALSEIAR